MTKEALLKWNYFKVLAGIAAIVIAAALWQRGYEFGQWLHRIVN